MDKNTDYMEDLYNLYDFIKNQLAKANMKKDKPDIKRQLKN